MDLQVKPYTFQTETPSKQDMFDGLSHARTAEVITDILTNSEISLIGLEGELGSGKSTVIELIKGKPESKCFNFIEFDVEKFQHGATKKALIETISQSLTENCHTESVKEDIRKTKDIALGNHFEYTSHVKSNINIWIIWFGISLIIATKLLPEALIGLGIFLKYIALSSSSILVEEINTERFKVDFYAITAIAFTIFPWYIIYCAQKRSKILGFLGVPPSTGDIFKRNSRDKISETIEINKEVGTYELQQALTSFSNLIDDSMKFVLVIDNLDRVTKDKVREVWSDIEVFTSIANSKIKLIIPYSKTHISTSISENKNDGVEFISKRIPITFRVSPIISTDWKNQFEKMLYTSFDEINENEIAVIIKIVSLWQDLTCSQITPRFLKK